MSGKQLWMVIALSLALPLSGCGGALAESGAEERGILSDPGAVKADGTNSCKGICGQKAPSGCWCDTSCTIFADCCLDRQTVCGGPSPAKTCASVKCAAGYHCEMKGINGGSIPVCIKNATKTCSDVGGYCLPLTYPMGQCKTGEKADTTAGLCGGLLGQSTTCCLPAPLVKAIVVTESDDGKTIAAQVGDAVEVQLGGNPTTGYAWTQTGASVTLPLISSKYTQTPTAANAVVVGGIYSFLFKVDQFAAGEVHLLQFAYARPWESKPIKTFSVSINVP